MDRIYLSKLIAHIVSKDDCIINAYKISNDQVFDDLHGKEGGAYRVFVDKIENKDVLGTKILVVRTWYSLNNTCFKLLGYSNSGSKDALEVRSMVEEAHKVAGVSNWWRKAQVAMAVGTVGLSALTMHGLYNIFDYYTSDQRRIEIEGNEYHYLAGKP